LSCNFKTRFSVICNNFDVDAYNKLYQNRLNLKKRKLRFLRIIGRTSAEMKAAAERVKEVAYAA